MIRLITGLPGAGKSLRAVQVIREALGQGRKVYVDGIDGLQAFGWEPCDARLWEGLPDGSLVVVDEAQKVWPTRRSGDVPPVIAALSEHRHRGFDFVLVTQHPTMLDAYVRKLVGEHEHVVRQFGMQASRIIRWTEAQDDPQSLTTRQRGTDGLWKYPSELYGLYKSATLHTVKRRVPFRVLAMPVLALAIAICGGWAWHSLGGIKAPPASEAAASARASEGARHFGGVVGSDGPRYTTPEDYAKAFVPRLEALPWSAPAFDKREVAAEPELLCVISETKGCRCYSEQITPIRVKYTICVDAARHGVYNPYRRPVDARRDVQVEDKS